MEQNRKTNTLWLLAAMSAPLAHFSGSGWLMTGLTALAVLPLSILPKNWDSPGKFLTAARLLWLGAVAGSLLTSASAYWPSDNDLAVPLIILILAAFTKERTAPGIGAVLAVCMALLSIPSAVSAAAKLEPDWLRPVAGPVPWTAALLFLLPALPIAEPGEKGKAIAGIGLLAVILSMTVQGVISPMVAISVPDPCYQTARTLGHMEPIIAAAVTLGWYAMTVYLYCTARFLAKKAGWKPLWASVLLLGTAFGAILTGVQLPQPYMTLFGAFLWVFCPFWNKNEKVEKT